MDFWEGDIRAHIEAVALERSLLGIAELLIV
jgi:hypothetical protein